MTCAFIFGKYDGKNYTFLSDGTIREVVISDQSVRHLETVHFYVWKEMMGFFSKIGEYSVSMLAYVIPLRPEFSITAVFHLTDNGILVRFSVRHKDRKIYHVSYCVTEITKKKIEGRITEILDWIQGSLDPIYDSVKVTDEVLCFDYNRDRTVTIFNHTIPSSKVKEIVFNFYSVRYPKIVGKQKTLVLTIKDGPVVIDGIIGAQGSLDNEEILSRADLWKRLMEAVHELVYETNKTRVIFETERHGFVMVSVQKWKDIGVYIEEEMVILDENTIGPVIEKMKEMDGALLCQGAHIR